MEADATTASLIKLAEELRTLDAKKNEKDRSNTEMGAVRLELTDSEEEGFTVPCNCHYATPPGGLERNAGERT